MNSAWRWAFYDWANSAFATVVMATFFPVFFKTVAASDLTHGDATLGLGLANGGASLIVFIVAPVLGGMVDYAGLKQRTLVGATLLSAMATSALFFIGVGDWLLALLCFIVALVGFFAAMVCYDSLLTDVCQPVDYARVSALGYALGYLGGGLVLALDVALIILPRRFGLSGPVAALHVSFVSVAVWWILFSLPLWLGVRETMPSSALSLSGAVSKSTRALVGTARDIIGYPGLWQFLLAYWLYIDAIHTIARMAVDFGLNMGLGRDALVGAILMTQFIGFPAALFFGWLAARWALKTPIFIGLTVYVLVAIWSVWLTSIWQFYIMAGLIGLVQGGVQALSRAYFAAIIPTGQSGRYFGVYNMLGKFSAILGPVLVGLTAAIGGNPRFSIVSVIVLLVGGAALLGSARSPQSVIAK